MIFDKDGTLFDFGATWEAWASGLLWQLAEQEAERAAFLGKLIGYDYLNQRFSPDSVAIAGTPFEIVQALSPEFPNMSDRELLQVLNAEAVSAPMREAVPLAALLHRLKSVGLKLGVATNDAEEPALAHLDAVGVRAFFDFIAGSDSGFGAKPEPGQLYAFCDQVGIATEHTVMVGDSTHDLVAGRAAGMATVAVLTGMADAEQLIPYADVVIPDIGHLPDWMGLTPLEG
ncbi:HAD family hydrolase [Marivita hallyeonensis]|uniref:HAD family hydrolase n=1 Tax=Marivita hallyeonensis TaxID=996342 RepID=UPI003182FE54